MDIVLALGIGNQIGVFSLDGVTMADSVLMLMARSEEIRLLFKVDLLAIVLRLDRVIFFRLTGGLSVPHQLCILIEG